MDATRLYLVGLTCVTWLLLEAWRRMEHFTEAVVRMVSSGLPPTVTETCLEALRLVARVTG